MITCPTTTCAMMTMRARLFLSIAAQWFHPHQIRRRFLLSLRAPMNLRGNMLPVGTFTISNGNGATGSSNPPEMPMQPFWGSVASGSRNAVGRESGRRGLSAIERGADRVLHLAETAPQSTKSAMRFRTRGVPSNTGFLRHPRADWRSKVCMKVARNRTVNFKALRMPIDRFCRARRSSTTPNSSRKIILNGPGRNRCVATSDVRNCKDVTERYPRGPA